MATNFPAYPATSFEQAVDLTIFASNQVGGVVNGDATSTVETENGPIPSLRKALVDNFYFKDPIAWQKNTTETVFNQLRFFSNGVLSAYYYAPTATTSNPVTMGDTPVGDNNWVLYAMQQQQIPSEVFPWLFETATGEELRIKPPYVFDSAIVTINGVVQIPNVAYTIEDSTIVLKEPLGTDPSTGKANLLFAYLGKVEAATSDYVQATILSSNIGASMIGEVGSCTALRSLLPTRTNQKVDVKGYNNNSTLGGGKFYYVTDSVTADDGGTFFRVNSSGGWKRSQNEIANLNVTHFGATMDGVTDDMPALLRMHNWSRGVDVSYGPGIILPAGKIALGSMDLGTTEIPAFKLRGPEMSFGVIPAVSIVPVNKTTKTPMFQFKSRRQEVSNIRFNGKDTVQPFMVNTVTRGSYIRVKSFVAHDVGGRVFQFKDTLDTKFDQVYSYRGKAAFIWGTWSNENPGSWDHLTAIEISNFNFGNHTGEYAVSLIRTGQALMTNGWFDHCEYPFDISQGGWILTRVTQENAVYPAATKYAKIIQTGCRATQGAGWDSTLSGYTPDMDDDGKIPTWVTNAYDNGGVNIDLTGSSFECGTSNQFQFSDTPILNNTNQDTWFHVARITQQELGRTCKMTFLGSSGWNSTGATLDRPTAGGFGGGKAHVFWELKFPDVANSQGGQVHWYGEGNCPIKEVRYVHSWQTIHVYVKIAAYARSTSMFIESNGDPRRKTGNPFYVVNYNESLTDTEMDAVVNNQKAVSRWAINGGNYDGAGIGLDIDNAKLLLNAQRTTVAGARWLTASIYGEDHQIPIQETNQSLRIPVYAAASLPSPSTNVYGMVLVRDSTLAQPMQLLFSNGSKWFLASDPANNTWRPA